MITYEELLKNRRSIRDFQDKKISVEIINEILNDTCQAPSAGNAQPWNFIVIQDKKLMDKISDESKKNILNKIEANPEHELKKYEQMLRASPSVFYNAPCLVIISCKKENRFFDCDCALAATYFMFASTARGLGTCWVGLGEYIEEPDLKKEIGLPQEHEIAAVLIVGYPENIPGENKRKPKILKMVMN